MQEALFSKNSYKIFNQLKKEARGHCMNCGKPLKWKHIHCQSCLIKLKHTGLELEKVHLGEVGKSTINYQQHLHRKFFDCNAHIDYRGLKENRIKNHIKKETIETATKKLKYMMLKKEIVHKGKPINKQDKHYDIFKEIQDVRNINKRLLYNTLLFYIDFHINNNPSFRTTMHFQISVINNLLINIENTYLRTKQGDIKFMKQVRGRIPFKILYYYIESLDQIVTPLIGELYDPSF